MTAGAQRPPAGAAEDAPLEPGGVSRERRWRSDIQGLRGVAILAVVCYHADPALLPGGFVGVDAFYVISGFLITGLLIRELEHARTVALRAFYARRIRRLLPCALLVIAATVIAGDLLQSPLDATATAKDALACALYVGNYRFALEQTNYLAAGVLGSPLQHYWSLGVEEQTYLVWPLLLLGAWRLGRGRRSSTRLAVVVLALASAASFYACLRLTHSDEPWAFFSFPTRAWELGVGALVAFAAPALRTIGRTVASLLGLGGLGALAYAVTKFGATTPWPGDAALVPVLGAGAVIAAGSARGWTPSAWLLGLPPLRLAGRISYPWYLWHWPVLVFAPLVLGHALRPVLAFELVGASAVLAGVTHVLVEHPLHYSAWLARRPRRGLALGASLTALGSAVCVASVAALALPVANAASSPVTLPVVAAGSGPSGASGPAAPLSPAARLLAVSTAQLQRDLTAAQRLPSVPADLTPSIAGAYDDLPQPYQDGCVDTYTAIALNPCVSGDLDSTTNVVLFGDSHAAMWFPAVEEAAETYGWRLYAWAKDTCPPLELDVFSPDLDRDYTECSEWRAEVLQQIEALHPALVILGVARHYSPVYGFTVYGPQWMDGLAGMVSTIRSLGARVLVLGPVPKPAFSVPSCLAEQPDDVEACATLRGAGVDLPGMRAEEETVLDAGGSYVNTLFWFCDTDAVCPPIVDGVLVYRDDNHLTATFATLLATPLDAALELALGGQSAPGSAVYRSPASSVAQP